MSEPEKHRNSGNQRLITLTQENRSGLILEGSSDKEPIGKWEIFTLTSANWSGTYDAL